MTREWLTLTLGAWCVFLVGAVTGWWWLYVAAILLQFAAAPFYTPEETS